MATDALDEVFATAIDDARAGGEWGLASLFRVFHPRLLRYVRSREPRYADDIVSDVWLAVATRIGSFEGDAGGFSAWIFTIARQRIADHRRTAARRRTEPTADVPEGRVAASAEQPALDQLSAQDAVQLIARHLNEDQREVVLLRCLGDLSAVEVASVMGRDEAWVRVTYHRAVHRLQARVQPRTGNERG